MAGLGLRYGPPKRDPLPRVVRKTLTKRERVAVSLRRHWLWAALPLAQVGAGFVVATWLAVQLVDADPLPNLIWLAWLVLLGRSCWQLTAWWRHRFVVTNERFILVDGWPSQTQSQLDLRFGKDITLRQNIFGQLFGFGDLELETAPREHPLRRITGIPDVPLVHRRISRLIQGDDDVEILPTYDGDPAVIVDASSRNAPERVHREAGDQPIMVDGRQGVRALFRGVASTLPKRAPVVPEVLKRPIKLPRLWTRQDLPGNLPNEPEKKKQNHFPDVMERF